MLRSIDMVSSEYANFAPPAAHPVGPTLQREHAAEVNVVTPKQKIKSS